MQGHAKVIFSRSRSMINNASCACNELERLSSVHSPKTCVPEKVQGTMRLKNNNKKLCHQGYIMMTTRPDN